MVSVRRGKRTGLESKLALFLERTVLCVGQGVVHNIRIDGP